MPDTDWQRIARDMRLHLVVRLGGRPLGAEVLCRACGADGSSGHDLPHDIGCPVRRFDEAWASRRDEISTGGHAR